MVSASDLSQNRREEEAHEGIPVRSPLSVERVPTAVEAACRAEEGINQPCLCGRERQGAAMTDVIPEPPIRLGESGRKIEVCETWHGRAWSASYSQHGSVLCESASNSVVSTIRGRSPLVRELTQSALPVNVTSPRRLTVVPARRPESCVGVSGAEHHAKGERRWLTSSAVLAGTVNLLMLMVVHLMALCRHGCESTQVERVAGRLSSLGNVADSADGTSAPLGCRLRGHSRGQAGEREGGDGGGGDHCERRGEGTEEGAKEGETM